MNNLFVMLLALPALGFGIGLLLTKPAVLSGRSALALTALPPVAFGVATAFC